MIIIDRKGTIHKINCMKIKDAQNLVPEITKACTVLGIENLETYVKDTECTIDEGWAAISKLPPYLSTDTSNWDLVMLKQSLVWFLGINKRYDCLRPYISQTELPYKDKLTMQINLCNLLEQRTEEMKGMEPDKQEEQRALIKLSLTAAQNLGLMGDGNMIDKLEVGTIITDRNGVERKAYSMLLSDRARVFNDLLPKIDGVMTANNTTEESYNALLEVARMALDDDNLTNEEIEEFMDAEFARKVIRVYLDMPM